MQDSHQLPSQASQRIASLPEFQLQNLLPLECLHVLAA